MDMDPRSRKTEFPIVKKGTCQFTVMTPCASVRINHQHLCHLWPPEIGNRPLPFAGAGKSNKQFYFTNSGIIAGIGGESQLDSAEGVEYTFDNPICAAVEYPEPLRLFVADINRPPRLEAINLGKPFARARTNRQTASNLKVIYLKA
jgi:hypothetical protein